MLIYIWYNPFIRLFQIFSVINTDRWFKLFSSCVVVRGDAMSAIYDLERSAFYELPNNFLKIIEMSDEMPVSKIKELYKKELNTSVERFFDQFVNEEIGFYTDDPLAFPNIDFTFESPFHITNSIVEILDLRAFDIKDVISQLDFLGCRAIQLRVLSIFSKKELEWLIVETFIDLRIQFIELYIPFSPDIKNEYLAALSTQQPRLQKIVVFDAPEDKVFVVESEMMEKIINYIKRDIRVIKNEIIKVEMFATNIQMFSEALNHNLGLNRKICIDKNGDMKNYFSHTRNFGNVRRNKISDIVEEKEFQNKWFISNDKIEICKKCQYRYACVSNSDLEILNGLFYKINMCEFDPGTNRWGQQSLKSPS
jgi:SPASM domain peptide maturase of grasp-with-spasm system